jgi:hypothetical protein
VFILVVVVMGIALGVLAFRSADNAAPPVVRNTLDSSQLTDADDQFKIIPLLSYFADLFKARDDLYQIDTWETDLSMCSKIAKGETSDFAGENTIFHILAAHPGLLSADEHRNLGVTVSERTFVNSVKWFLDKALIYIDDHASAYEQRIVTMSRDEIRRYLDTEVESRVKKLDAIDDAFKGYMDILRSAFLSSEDVENIPPNCIFLEKKADPVTDSVDDPMPDQGATEDEETDTGGNSSYQLMVGTLDTLPVLAFRMTRHDLTLGDHTNWRALLFEGLNFPDSE